jgi:signal transduction histidine kinase
LNAVLGYQDLLEGEVVGPLNEVQKQHLGRIKLSAEQLLDLINQILSLSRIEAGKEEVRCETFDLAELVASTVALMEPVAAKKGLELGFAADASPLLAETDPGKVRQILLNLIGNAIKFSERGGVTITLQQHDGDSICRVQDTGIGIKAEDLARIFEPFFQVDGSSTRRQDGSGLGLPVSRELARLLGGDVDVESEPARGSTFTLRLPSRPGGGRIIVGRIGEDAPAGENTSTRA